jgi:hypothetical protein
MTGGSQRGVHAELYVRSLAPRAGTETQTAVLETLQRLSDRDTLAGYELYVCGGQLPARPAETETAYGQYLLDRIAVFSEWARRNDCSLGPLFDRKTVDSSITGTTREVITVPLLALAEYEGGDLRFVTPCSLDGDLVTVRDRLEDLLAGGDTPTTALPDAYTDGPDVGFSEEQGEDVSDSRPLVR